MSLSLVWGVRGDNMLPMITSSNRIDVQHNFPKDSQDIKGKAKNDDINVRSLVSYDPQRGMVVVKGQEEDEQ